MLVSSSERESFGMSIVEAMRAGLPVVSTRAPVGPEEIIRDGVDGLFVPVGDAAGLAAAMCALLEDPARRSEMGRHARENAARFDPVHVARQYDSIFEALAPERSHAPRARRPRLAARVVQGLATARAMRPQASEGADTAAPMAPAVHVELLRTNDLQFTAPLAPNAWERLVLVKRRSGDEESIELAPTESGTVGVLPASVDLSEGRWDAHLQTGAGARSRAAAGRCDTRHAATMPLAHPGRPFARRLPYETADHFLAVRAWLRPAHAEVDAVERSGGLLELRGRVVSQEEGGVPAGDVRVVVSSRLDGVPEWSSAPVAMQPAGYFRVSIDLDVLSGHRVTRHDDWDLHLEFEASGLRARLGRLADDIVDRKHVVTYQVTRSHPETDPRMHEEHPVPVIDVRPYFTVNNDLSLYVTEG